MLYVSFDYLMRCYAKVALPGAIVLFIADELGYKAYGGRVFVIWVFMNCILVLVAWLLQLRLNAFVRGNSDRLFRLSLLFRKGRVPLPHELPVWVGGDVPERIQTVVPAANELLAVLQLAPYILEMSVTQFDHDWRRLSWLRIRKDDPDAILKELMIGDAIYYHHKRSVMGKVIRALTRSYWEHVASYIGEHEVLDVVPGGVRREKIRPWIENPDVDLSVMRVRGIAEKLERDALLKMAEGNGYNYFGVFKVFWKIITGQTGLGGVGLFRLISYIVVSSIVAILLSFPPVHTRVEVIWISLLSVYAIESIYHPIAYRNNLAVAFTLPSERKPKP